MLGQIEHRFAWAGLIELLALGLVCAIILAAIIAGWMLTHPPRRTYASAVVRARPGDPSELASPRAFESWTFTTDGLSSPVWDIPGDDPAGPVVIMTHGWADGRIGALLRLGPFLPISSRIIAWDLRGHGDATGICRLGTREVEDLAALVEHLGASSVILFGWSLGGGVSIAAAARDDLSPRIAAVIAEAPYRVPGTPARRVMHVRGLPYRLNLPITFFVLGFLFGVGPRWRGFDRAAHARRLKCPLLVLHGELDRICPVEDGRAIAEAAPAGSLTIIADSGHNDLWVEEPHAARCSEAVRRFLAAVGPSSR